MYALKLDLVLKQIQIRGEIVIDSLETLLSACYAPNLKLYLDNWDSLKLIWREKDIRYADRRQRQMERV